MRRTQTYDISFGNATDGWTSIVTQSLSGTSSTLGNGIVDLLKNTILIVAKGSNVYDTYYNGQLATSSKQKQSLTLSLKTTTGSDHTAKRMNPTQA